MSTLKPISRIERAATAAACLQGVLVLACFAISVLPSTWVGRPYTWLAEKLNPGIDAPDNWAMAFTYFLRITTVLAIGISIAALIAIWSHLKNGGDGTATIQNEKDETATQKGIT